MCYERRRAEACVDESANTAPAQRTKVKLDLNSWHACIKKVCVWTLFTYIVTDPLGGNETTYKACVFFGLPWRRAFPCPCLQRLANGRMDMSSPTQQHRGCVSARPGIYGGDAGDCQTFPR